MTSNTVHVWFHLLIFSYRFFLRSWKWQQSLHIMKVYTSLNQVHDWKHIFCAMIWKHESDNKELQICMWFCQNKKENKSITNPLIKTANYNDFYTSIQFNKVYSRGAGIKQNKFCFLHQIWFWSISNFRVVQPTSCIFQDNFPRIKNAPNHHEMVRYFFRDRKCEVSQSWSTKVFIVVKRMILAKQDHSDF